MKQRIMTTEHADWARFYNGLGNAVHAKGCDHTTRHSRGLMESLGFKDDDIRASLASMAEHGGYCDCEILINLCSD